MRQNAHQILRMVKEAFPGQPFDESAITIDSSCSDKASDRDIMNCMWSWVARTRHLGEQANAAEITRALTTVSTAQSTCTSYTKGTSV